VRSRTATWGTAHRRGIKPRRTVRVGRTEHTRRGASPSMATSVDMATSAPCGPARPCKRPARLYDQRACMHPTVRAGPPASRPAARLTPGPAARPPRVRLTPGPAARPGNPTHLAPGERGPAGSGYRLSRSSGAVTCSETRPTSRFAAFPRSATTIPIVPSDHGVASPGRPGSPGSPGARETRHRGRNASCTRDEALTIKASGAPRRGIRRRRGIRSLAAPAGRVSPWRRPPRGPWPSRP
jgi:hypothetical protein